MTDTHETIADIVAAKRRLAAEMGKALGDQHTSVEMLKDDADRIEAAHKREIEATAAKCCQLGRLAGYGASEIKHQQEPVGDAAKLREALEEIVRYAENEDGMDDPYCADGHICAGIARKALSAPPRNCDRPECATTKAAQDVWRKEDGGKTAYYEWLLATATEKEGGNDAD